MDGLLRLLQRVETCKGAFRHGRFVVPIVRLLIQFDGGRAASPIANTTRSDIAYYGINLNQSVILARIGYATGPNPWTKLFHTAVGNIIVQSAVRLPAPRVPLPSASWLS